MINQEEKIEQIREAFEEINGTLFGYPNQQMRDSIREQLINKLSFLDSVDCNEANNPPVIVDMECIVARCNWGSLGAESFYYIDLVFGDRRRAEKVMIKYLN